MTDRQPLPAPEPCPWCGEEVSVIGGSERDGRGWKHVPVRIGCDTEGCFGAAATTWYAREAAIRAWNFRAARSGPPAPSPTVSLEQRCPVCEGMGFVAYPKGVAPGQHWSGTGAANHPCHRCGGSGTIALGVDPSQTPTLPTEPHAVEYAARCEYVAERISDPTGALRGFAVGGPIALDLASDLREAARILRAIDAGAAPTDARPPAMMTCGAWHPDPARNAATEEAAAQMEGYAGPEGCGESLPWMMMFRCAECSRYFDHDCLLKHFASHGGAAPTLPDETRDLMLAPDASDAVMADMLDELADCAEGEPTNVAWNLQTIAKRLRVGVPAPQPTLQPLDVEKVAAALEAQAFVGMSGVAASNIARAIVATFGVLAPALNPTTCEVCGVLVDQVGGKFCAKHRTISGPKSGGVSLGGPAPKEGM